MYIKVAYWNTKANAYASWEYIYTTSLPLKVGDKVLADAGTVSGQKAIVTAINVPETEISPHWKNRIKEVIAYDLEDNLKMVVQ